MSYLEPHRWRGPSYLQAVNTIRPERDWNVTVPILRIGPYLYFMFGWKVFVCIFIDFCSFDCLNLSIVEITDHAEQGSPARPLPSSIMQSAATFVNDIYIYIYTYTRDYRDLYVLLCFIVVLDQEVFVMKHFPIRYLCHFFSSTALVLPAAQHYTWHTKVSVCQQTGHQQTLYRLHTQL